MNGLKARILEGHGQAVSVQSSQQSTRFMPERRAGEPRWLTVELLDDELVVFKANGSDRAQLQLKGLGGTGGTLIVQQGDDIRYLSEGQTVRVYLAPAASVICRTQSMRSPDGRGIGVSTRRG